MHFYIEISLKLGFSSKFGPSTSKYIRFRPKLRCASVRCLGQRFSHSPFVLRSEAHACSPRTATKRGTLIPAGIGDNVVARHLLASLFGVLAPLVFSNYTARAWDGRATTAGCAWLLRTFGKDALSSAEYGTGTTERIVESVARRSQ